MSGVCVVCVHHCLLASTASTAQQPYNSCVNLFETSKEKGPATSTEKSIATSEQAKTALEQVFYLLICPCY
jgi:hypothetical protein